MSAVSDPVVACTTQQSAAEVVRLDDLAGVSALPRSNGELVFDAPWQARAFGMAVLLCQEGRFEWPEFQAALINEIDRTGQDGVDEYYECWLSALTTVTSDLLSAHDLRHREGAFRSGEIDTVF